MEPGGYEICRVCGWEDDPVQANNPAFEGGANKLSLRAARASYLAIGVSDPTIARLRAPVPLPPDKLK